MRLLSYLSPEREARVGVLSDGDQVVDLAATASAAGVGVPTTMPALIAAWPEVGPAVERMLEGEVIGRPLAEVELLAPIPRPGKIIGVGLNYSEHVSESARALDTDHALPERPILFDKPATAVIGPGAEILHDARLTAQLDWECELAVIIGRRARHVDADDAYAHVLGYSVINDISARDQRRGGQWFFSKGQDTYAPFGPVIVTADEIPDPGNLNLRLSVNGVEKQNSNTRFMLFRIPELIADITSGMTLEPGDVIATGSPSGVGAGMDPPEFLVPGDAVEAEVQDIGVLRSHVVDAREAMMST